VPQLTELTRIARGGTGESPHHRGAAPLGLRPDGGQSAPGALRKAGLHAVVDGPEVRESGAASALGKALAAVTRLGAEGFWVHLDVDVLDDDLMPAVDYRHPGGLTWEEAAEILRGLLHASGARGLEVTIFNPRLDSDRSHARHLSDLITNVIPASRIG
jgi:arginase